MHNICLYCIIHCFHRLKQNVNKILLNLYEDLFPAQFNQSFLLAFNAMGLNFLMLRFNNKAWFMTLKSQPVLTAKTHRLNLSQHQYDLNILNEYKYNNKYYPNLPTFFINLRVNTSWCAQPLLPSFFIIEGKTTEIKNDVE